MFLETIGMFNFMNLVFFLLLFNVFYIIYCGGARLWEDALDRLGFFFWRYRLLLRFALNIFSCLFCYYIVGAPEAGGSEVSLLCELDPRRGNVNDPVILRDGAGPAVVVDLGLGFDLDFFSFDEGDGSIDMDDPNIKARLQYYINREKIYFSGSFTVDPTNQKIS